MTDKAVDELNELVVAESLYADNVEKVSEITVHICCCWRPFSLTKYCAIFSKDKGYFCPIANINLEARPLGLILPSCSTRPFVADVADEANTAVRHTILLIMLKRPMRSTELMRPAWSMRPMLQTW